MDINDMEATEVETRELDSDEVESILHDTQHTELTDEEAAAIVKHVESQKRMVAVDNPGKTEFHRSNGLDVAQRCIASLDPSFLAFANAATNAPKPPTGLAKVWRYVTALFMRAVKRVAKFFGRKSDGIVLKIEKLAGVEKYLTRSARALVNAERKALRVECDGPTDLAVARYAAIKVPLEPDGSISERYIRAWAWFLNYVAESGLWVEGVLAPPSTIATVMTELAYEKVLFTFLYTKQMPEDSLVNGDKLAADKLNQALGCKVFGVGGDFADSSAWRDLPGQ